MAVEVLTKTAVTVAEMARMVGLSRARFYQLLGTAFPHPLYDVTTRRPSYTEEQQRTCLEVRRRNCGIDGRPVLFYARRLGAVPSLGKPRKIRAIKKAEPHADLIAGLKALGLTTVTALQVQAVV